VRACGAAERVAIEAGPTHERARHRRRIARRRQRAVRSAARDPAERRDVGDQRRRTARERLDHRIAAALGVAAQHQEVRGAEHILHALVRQPAEQVDARGERRIGRLPRGVRPRSRAVRRGTPRTFL